MEKVELIETVIKLKKSVEITALKDRLTKVEASLLNANQELVLQRAYIESMHNHLQALKYEVHHIKFPLG